MRPRATLRTRLMLTTAVLVVAVVGTVLAVVAWIVRDQTTQAARAASLRTRSALEKTVQEQLDRLSVDSRLVANLPNTKSVTAAPDGRTVSEFLESRRAEIAVDWILWTDDLGAAFAQTRQAEFAIGEDLSHLAGVGQALGGKGWSGTLLRDGCVTLASSQPVTINGYVKATFTAGKVMDGAMLAGIAASAQAEIAVFEGSQLVASTVPLAGTHVREEDVQGVQVGDARYIGSFIEVPGADDLRFLALVPEAAVSAPFEPLRHSLFALLLAGLAAAVGIGISLARRVTEPLEALIGAANELQAGRWPEPFAPKARDEIGLLQSHFDDMTRSLRSSHERLVSMLEIDPLTELWNHRSFRQKLESAIARAGDQAAVVLLDVDDFETFNRAHGAVEGDRTLVEVARALRAVCGEEAVCGRYGGNEFAVIAEGVDPRFLAERVRAQVESETRVTVSVGYCRHCEATAQSDLMLLAAGMAVSQAKSGGRNRVREFEGFEMATDDEGLRRFLRGGSYAAVRALAEAVDAKDRYTRGHSQRVAEYAKELAQACGFDAGFVELVYVAGTLHDVGKIGVPDEVLNKTSRLTEGEFAQIKLHPELGERIVAQIPELRDTLPGIRSHHERYDGRGYPDGLAGEAIPLIARILTVADAFDAMTSDRSYRLGMSEAHAISQIAEGAGTHFDPDLAQRFVVLMRGREKAA